MFGGHQLPSLWDPAELFFHLAVWAGIPVILVAVVATLLGIYKSIKDWIEFGHHTVRAVGVAGQKVKSWTTTQQRAMVRLLIFAVLTVAFSYMAAVIIAAVVQAVKADPNDVFSIQDLVNRVAVTPWPPAVFWTVAGEVGGIAVLGIACITDLRGLRKLVTGFGGIVWIVTWVVGALLGVDTLLMLLGLLLAIPLHNPDSGAPPVPLVVTVGATASLCLLIAQLLPRVRTASDEAFDSR